MDDAAKAAKRKEIEEKVAAMKLEQKKLEVGVCGGRIGDVLFLSCVGESGGAFISREEKNPLFRKKMPPRCWHALLRADCPICISPVG